MNRVALYARVGAGDRSIDAPLRELRAWAERRGLSEGEWLEFVDVDEGSGGRPGRKCATALSPATLA